MLSPMAACLRCRCESFGVLSQHNRPVQTGDGWISFTINTDKQVQAFLDAVGRSELKEDPRFASVVARAKNVALWFEIRGAPLTSKTTAEWLQIFRDADIAAMPCNTIETLQADPHLMAARLLGSESHPTEGETVTIRSSIVVDGEHSLTEGYAQPKGWESASVAMDIGYSSTEIQSLFERKTLIAANVGEV